MCIIFIIIIVIIVIQSIVVLITAESVQKRRMLGGAYLVDLGERCKMKLKLYRGDRATRNLTEFEIRNYQPSKEVGRRPPTRPRAQAP